MFRNCLKTAIRSLIKNKGFTFINVFGLALGLATCLLIVFYVFDELSYDRYNTKYGRIYRVNTDVKYAGVVSSFAISAPPVGDAMVREFPEVEKATRIGVGTNFRFKKGGEIIEEDNVVFCDPAVFYIFTLPMIKGDPKTALAEPNSVVITKSMALKYFNTTNALGKTITISNNGAADKVTGVIEDMPATSHFKADFFMPLINHDNNWSNLNYNTYILLKPGADYKRLETRFADLLRSHMNTADFNYDKFVAKGNFIQLSLTPLTDIHLRSNRQNELSANGNIQYIYIFSAIAIFILALASQVSEQFWILGIYFHKNLTFSINYR